MYVNVNASCVLLGLTLRKRPHSLPSPFEWGRKSDYSPKIARVWMPLAMRVRRKGHLGDG
ncbi:protein of unknown function (plasmid) [Caballeronia sp. S22]